MSDFPMDPTPALAPTADTEQLRRWIRPSCRRRSAGAAEDGAATTPDANLPS